MPAGAAALVSAPYGPPRPSAASAAVSELRARRLGHDVTGARRLQRYFEMEKTEGEGPLFETQAADAELDEERGRLTRERQSFESAPLLVADDRSLAVHATADEPKEFFALASSVGEYNDQLETVETPIRLETQPAKSVDVGGKASLVRVVPRLDDDPESYPGPPPLLAHRCIELAGHVVGSHNLALVLQSAETKDSVTTPLHTDLKGAPEIERLAGFLSEGGETKDVLETLPEVLQSEETPELPGKAYGTRQGKGELDEAGKALGINEWALPEVGEGWGIFTVAGDEKGLEDYSVLDSSDEPLRRDSTWGYHFAGVVAKSGDGADRVALENYNRSPRIGDLTSPVFEEMKRKDELGELVDEREVPLKLNKVWQEYYEGVVASEDPKTLWFFRLYGTRKGQTFHEQQAKGGSHVNPLTVRVRRDYAEDLRIRLGDSAYGVRQMYRRFSAPDRGVTERVRSLGNVWEQEVEMLTKDVDPSRLGPGSDLLEYLEELELRLREIESGQVVPELVAALRSVERRKSKRVVTDREALAAEIEEQQRPGFWDVAGDFFDEMHQGIPDLELDRRATVEALGDFVDALPAKYL